MGVVNDKKHEMYWSKEIAIKNGVSFGFFAKNRLYYWIGQKNVQIWELPQLTNGSPAWKNSISVDLSSFFIQPQFERIRLSIDMLFLSVR